MKAKEYLKQLQAIQAKIDRRFEETGMLRSMLESTTSPFGKDYLSKTSNQDKFANIIAKICDIESEIEGLMAQKFDIICTIEEIESPNSFRAIYYKYVNRMTTAEICKKMDVAEPTLYGYIGDGYKELSEILKNRVSDRNS